MRQKFQYCLFATYLFVAESAFACGSPYYLVRRDEQVSSNIQTAGIENNIYPTRPVYIRDKSTNIFNDFTSPLPSDSCIESTTVCNGDYLLFDVRAIGYVLNSKKDFCNEREHTEMRNAILSQFALYFFPFFALAFLFWKLFVSTYLFKVNRD
jgi:hypothetical protein